MLLRLFRPQERALAALALAFALAPALLVAIGLARRVAPPLYLYTLVTAL